MIYPRWMLNLLFYFDLWGFCTQFKRSPKQRNFHRLTLATHTILAFVATSLIAKYLQRLDGDLSLRAVNDVLKFTVLLLVYWLSIFELYSKRYTQRKFWYIVDYIDKRFCSLQRFNLGKYPLKLQIYFLSSLFVYCIDFKQLFSVEFVSFWMCYLYVVWIHQNRSFYYLFYLEWIKQELKHVVHEANEFVYTYQTSMFQTKNYAIKHFHRNRFKWLRQYFGSIYDMTDVMNSVFGWSNVVTILVSVHLILADTNRLYWKILNRYNTSVIRKIIPKTKINYFLRKLRFFIDFLCLF